MMEANIESEQAQPEAIEGFISFGEWWERFGDQEEEEPAPEFRVAA
jgi:hypothetical protein